MSSLKRIQIKGFRSIKEMSLELGPLNVLIGANGAGKSNLIAFFKLMNELMAGRLQQHIGTTGRATANLYFGPRMTPQLEAEMKFEVENGTDTYRMRLFHAAGDSLIFAEELLSFHQTGYPQPKEASFFEDFELEPAGSANRDIILNWRHRSSDLVSGPHQLSDGTLRAICLISLLLQPREALPCLIVVDEPELGLHPYALDVIASLFRAASHHTQVLVSTQSSAFVDNFAPKDIVVVERNGEATEFDRPNAHKLDAWLEDYSLDEIWEKNVIGAGPR